VVMKKVESSFDDALKTARALATSFREMVHDIGLHEAELELGFQFTGKGNVYLVQSEVHAALKMKFVFRTPRAPAEDGD
jgi:NTP-dependent ternary system trypsin peptidase co-occuring protein